MLARRTTLRISFSVTTNRDAVLRLYEPHCPSFGERLRTIRSLREAGIATYATLAPMLPCDPEDLADAAIAATGRDLIGDPLHNRALKSQGATTREAAWRVSAVHGHDDYLEPVFQANLVDRIRTAARAAGYEFTVGPKGFGKLSV